jgi:hypothetical protein
MSLAGTWFNELNSTMILDDDGVGNLSGTYESRVGVPLGPCRLIGRYDTDTDAPGTALGFVVVWQTEAINANATTTWSGQYQVVDGEEQIFTMWLLSVVNAEDTDWNSIEVGQDIFTRFERSDAEIGRFRGKRAASHPIK